MFIDPEKMERIIRYLPEAAAGLMAIGLIGQGLGSISNTPEMGQIANFVSLIGALGCSFDLGLAIQLQRIPFRKVIFGEDAELTRPMRVTALGLMIVSATLEFARYMSK